MRGKISSPVLLHRVKLFLAFAAMLGTFAILQVVLKSTMTSKNSEQDGLPPSALAVEAIPSFSAVVNNLNINKINLKNINPSNYVWHNKYDVVHVVETDLLQYQLDLNNLIEARLGLFETFTVPSIKQQTNQQFLWLIWTDPKLSAKRKQQLVDLVRDIPNAVVLGFRRNKKRDFREFNGMTENDIDAALFCGSRRLLLDYYRSSKDRLLMETRLDADDALNKDYIDTVQREGSATVGKSDVKTDFRIFCPEHHTEWRYYKPGDTENEDGHLVLYHNPNFCINSGLTIGYQVNAKARHLQTLENCNMNKWFNQCVQAGYTGVVSRKVPNTGHIIRNCVGSTTVRRNLNGVDAVAPGVLVSRSPSAAGFKRVLGLESSYKKTFESDEAQKDAWKMIKEDFGVDKDEVVKRRRAMEDNMVNILRDALAGQCSPGHSCLSSTKRKLLKLLAKAKSKAMRNSPHSPS